MDAQWSWACLFAVFQSSGPRHDESKTYPTVVYFDISMQRVVTFGFSPGAKNSDVTESAGDPPLSPPF